LVVILQMAGPSRGRFPGSHAWPTAHELSEGTWRLIGNGEGFTGRIWTKIISVASLWRGGGLARLESRFAAGSRREKSQADLRIGRESASFSLASLWAPTSVCMLRMGCLMPAKRPTPARKIAKRSAPKRTKATSNQPRRSQSREGPSSAGRCSRSICRGAAGGERCPTGGSGSAWRVCWTFLRRHMGLSPRTAQLNQTLRAIGAGGDTRLPSPGLTSKLDPSKTMSILWSSSKWHARLVGSPHREHESRPMHRGANPKIAPDKQFLVLEEQNHTATCFLRMAGQHSAAGLDLDDPDWLLKFRGTI